MTIKQLAKINNLDISKYDSNQLKKGFEVEKEHDTGITDVVNEPVDLLKITMVHLDELPDYYDKLEKMEESLRLLVRKMIREHNGQQNKK